MKLIASIPPRDSNTNPTRSVVPSLLPTILCTKSVTSHRITTIVDMGGRKAKVLMGCRWPNRSLPQAIPADCRVCRSPCSQQSSRRTGLLCSSVSLQMGSKHPPSHLPQSHCPSPGELEFHPWNPACKINATPPSAEHTFHNLLHKQTWPDNWDFSLSLPAQGTVPSLWAT